MEDNTSCTVQGSEGVCCNGACCQGPCVQGSCQGSGPAGDGAPRWGDTDGVLLEVYSGGVGASPLSNVEWRLLGMWPTVRCLNDLLPRHLPRAVHPGKTGPPAQALMRAQREARTTAWEQVVALARGSD